MSHISQAKIKFVQSLKYKKYRQKHECYAVEGIKACQTALQVGLAPTFVVYRGELPDFISLSITHFQADEQTMKKISSFDSPPQLLSIFPTPKERQFDLQMAKGNVILFLDRIQDPGNLGTIVRTADWYGVKSVILNRGCVDVYNPKSIQAAMGCHLNLEFYYAEIDETRRFLTEYTFAGLDMNGQVLNNDLLKTKKVVLVVGNEGKGLSKEIGDAIDITVSIPGNEHRIAESLNAGVSVAISLDRLLG